MRMGVIGVFVNAVVFRVYVCGVGYGTINVQRQGAVKCGEENLVMNDYEQMTRMRVRLRKCRARRDGAHLGKKGELTEWGSR